jgi:TP901 family phage tail tape measure protein
MDVIKMVLKMVDEASAPLRNAVNEVNNLDSTAQRVSKAGLSVLKGAMTAVLTVATALTTSMFALGGSALALGGDFEQQMNIVSVSVDGAKESMDLLEAKAISLGNNTAFSALEAASGIEMLGKNGLTAQQILDGALESSLNLAAATGTDLANASDIATSAMLNFKTGVADLPEIVDLIAGSTGVSKFGIEDFAYALANAGGVAGATGVDFHDFATVIAGISSSFSSGQDAGTSFKSFLVALPGNSSQAREAIADLGLEFFDANGNMKSMSDIAGQLQASFSGLTEEQKLTYAQTIFGTDAMRAALSMAELGADGFNDLADAVASVDANEQAAARMAGFKGAIDSLKGAWEGLMIQLFNSGLGEWATQGVTALASFLTALQENEQFINGFLGTVKTVFGTLGKLLNEAVAIGQTTFTTLSSLYTENETTVNAWMGNISGYWQTFLSAVDTVIILAVGLWQNILKPAWGEIEPFVASFLETVQSNWGRAKDNLGATFDFLVALWQVVLYPSWNAIAPFVKGVWDAVLIAVETVSKLIEPILNSLTNLLRGDFSQAWEDAKEAGKIAWEGLRDIVLSIGEGLITSVKQIGSDIVAGLMSGITDMMESAKSTVTDFGNNVIGWFNDIFERKSPAKVFIRMAVDLIKGFIVGFQDETALADLKSEASNVGAAVIEAFGIALGITKAQTEGEVWIESFIEGAADKLEELIPGFKERIEAMRRAAMPGPALIIPEIPMGGSIIPNNTTQTDPSPVGSGGYTDISVVPEIMTKVADSVSVVPEIMTEVAGAISVFPTIMTDVAEKVSIANEAILSFVQEAPSISDAAGYFDDVSKGSKQVASDVQNSSQIIQNAFAEQGQSAKLSYDLGLSSSDDYLGELGRLESGIIRQMGLVDQGGDEWQAYATQLKGVQDESEKVALENNGVTKTLSDISRVGKAIGDVVGGEFGKVANQIAEAADAGISLVTALSKGDWIGAIASGIRLLGTLFGDLSNNIEAFTKKSMDSFDLLGEATTKGILNDNKEVVSVSGILGLLGIKKEQINEAGAQAGLEIANALAQGLKDGLTGSPEDFKKWVDNYIDDMIIQTVIAAQDFSQVVEFIKQSMSADDDTPGYLDEGERNTVQGMLGSIRDTVMNTLGSMGITFENPTPETTKPTTDETVKETAKQAEIQFGNIPQAVQFAVATPLMEAANTMMIAATLMRDTFSGGIVTSPEVFTTSSANLFDSSTLRFDKTVSRLEGTLDRFSERGIMLKIEHTIKSSKSSFVSKTAVAR